jgi:hypothetical protein
MHLFDGTDSIENTQDRFWKVFGGVTGVTYTLGALALSSFGWKGVWNRLGKRLRFAEKSPTAPKHKKGELKGRPLSSKPQFPNLFRGRKAAVQRDEERGGEEKGKSGSESTAKSAEGPHT